MNNPTLEKKCFSFLCCAENATEEVKEYNKAIDELLMNSTLKVNGIPDMQISINKFHGGSIPLKVFPKDSEITQIHYIAPKKDGVIIGVDVDKGVTTLKTPNYQYHIFDYSVKKK